MTGVLNRMKIKELRDAGLSKSAVASYMALHRNTVAKYWDDGVDEIITPRHHRSSKVAFFKDYITKRLDKYPLLSAERIFDEIKKQGYCGSARTVRRYVARIRPAKEARELKPFETLPGEQAQIDWGHLGTRVLDGNRVKLYVFVFTLCWSRIRYAEIIASLDLATFAGCLHRALMYVGGVPQTIVFDNAKTVVSDRVGNVVQFNQHLLQMALVYGFSPYACWINDPQSKGKVESNVKYVKNGFFYGTDFTSLGEANQKLDTWLEDVANAKIHSTIQAVPWERLEQERTYLKELPAIDGPVPIYETRKATKTSLISVGGNRYSVPAQLARKQVVYRRFEDRIEILDGKRVIAHQILVRGSGRQMIDDSHYPAHHRDSKGRKHALQQQFEDLAPAAAEYLQGLSKSRNGHLRDQMKQIVKLAHECPPTQVQTAMTRAITFGAYGYGSLKNILVKLSECPQVLADVPQKNKTPIQDEYSVGVERRDINYYRGMGV